MEPDYKTRCFATMKAPDGFDTVVSCFKERLHDGAHEGKYMPKGEYEGTKMWI